MALRIPSSASTASTSFASAATATATINQQKAFVSFSYWPTTNHRLSSRLNLNRPFPLYLSSPNSWSGRCHATSPGPPSPPPESDPQPHPPPSSSSGVAATLSRIQDTAQIFFAVLFWMSLFFWASAWDGRNDDTSNRGPGFRK